MHGIDLPNLRDSHLRNPGMLFQQGIKNSSLPLSGGHLFSIQENLDKRDGKKQTTFPISHFFPLKVVK
jgi:hypothetical protein